MKIIRKTVTGSLLLLQAFFLFAQDDIQSLRTHVEILAHDSLEGRGLGTDGAGRAREYIVNQFRDAGIQPLGADYLLPFSFRQHLAWIKAYNIAGVVEGSDPERKDEYIILGAHYDHLGYELKNEERVVFPGADDNASGVASIIELGRYFAQNPHLLKRSLIIVAFDAEESGLIGSEYFVNNSPVPLESIKVMFSMDMVGMYEANQGVELKNMASLEGGVRLAEEVADQQSIQISKTAQNIQRRTDSAPFERKGIPAIHVFTGTNSPYHKPGDTYDLLDYEGMYKINSLMKELVAELSAKDKLEPVPAVVARAERIAEGRSKRLYTGFVMNYGAGHHRYEDEFFRANRVFNFSGGFFFQVPLGTFFTLQPEVLYDFNGSETEGGSFRRHSITAPVNLQFGTPRAHGNDVRLYVFGGAYYRYNLGGRTAGNTIDFDDFEQEEWGYSLGVGLEVFRFYMGYTHRKGVSNLLRSDVQKILDTNNYFTVGYRF